MLCTRSGLRLATASLSTATYNLFFIFCLSFSLFDHPPLRASARISRSRQDALLASCMYRFSFSLGNLHGSSACSSCGSLSYDLDWRISIFRQFRLVNLDSAFLLTSSGSSSSGRTGSCFRRRMRRCRGSASDSNVLGSSHSNGSGGLCVDFRIAASGNVCGGCGCCWRVGKGGRWRGSTFRG